MSAAVAVAAMLLGVSVFAVAQSTSDPSNVPGVEQQVDPVLSDVLARVQDPVLLGASVGLTPDTFEAPKAPWLYVRVARPDPGEPATGGRQAWLAAVVAGALRSRSQDQGIPSVTGYTVENVAPDGTTQVAASVLLGRPVDDARAAVDAAALRDALIQGAARNGLSVEKLEQTTTAAAATTATLVATDARRIYENRSVILSNLFPGNEPQGSYYLTLRERGAAPFLVAATARDAQIGIYWARSDLDNPRVVSPLLGDAR